MKLLKESYFDGSVYVVVDDHEDIRRVYEYRDDAEESLRSYEKVYPMKLPVKFIEWLENKLVFED